MDTALAENKLRLLQGIEKTLRAVSHRQPIDRVVPISAHMPWFIDYQDRKYIYVYSSTALTLTLEDIGTVSIQANSWTNVCFPQGLRVFAQGQGSIVVVLVRATDEIYSFDTEMQVTFPAGNETVTLSGTQPINFAKSGGVTISASNPLVTQDYTNNFVVNLDQCLLATNGNIATATNGGIVPCALSLFNPSSTNVAALVYSIQVSADTGNAGNNTVTKTTTDPSGTTGYTNTSINVTNMNFGASTGSQLSFCASANGVTASPTQVGTPIEEFGFQKGICELLPEDNHAILVTPGTGLAIYTHVNTAGDAFPCTVKWIEYAWASNPGSPSGGGTGSGSTGSGGSGGTTSQYLQLINFGDNTNSTTVTVNGVNYNLLQNPYCAGTNLLVYWSQIETAENQYDWTVLDNLITPWRTANKKVIIRLMTAGWKAWAPPYSTQGTPTWVFNAGVPKYTELDGSIKPVYWNATYQTKLTNFINAVAARYDGKSYITGFQIAVGDGGECKPSSYNNANKQTEWEALGYTTSLWQQTIYNIVQIYLNAFKATQLIQQQDVDWYPNSSGSGPYGPYKDWVAANMVANKPRIWLQFDSEGVSQNTFIDSTLAGYMKEIPTVMEQREASGTGSGESGDTMAQDLQLANSTATSRLFLIFPSDMTNTANVSLFQEYTGV